MRQRPINTTEILPTPPKGTAAKSGIHNDGMISLKSLLFDSGLSKEDWIIALKHHSTTVTHLLLNDQIEEFNQYLRSELDSALSEEMGSSYSIIKNNSLVQMNCRPLLQDFLQLAILIEHSTIPPYLTALYSIKDGANLLASQIIRSVAAEEMRHMIMVCNVMNAVDIQPSVNQPENYPVYPMKLPMNVDFFIGLEKFSTNSMATFIAIESRSSLMVKDSTSDHDTEKTVLLSKDRVETTDFWNMKDLTEFLEKNINSISEFYDVLFFYIVIFQIIAFYKTNQRFPQSFEELNNGGIFTGNPAKQIRPEQYDGSGGTLHTVEDLSGVMKVFKEIKGQGEGTDDMIFDINPSQFEEGAGLAHYFRFKEIFHEHFYIGGNYHPFKDDQGMMSVTIPPVGKELPVDWNAAYPMKSNVKLADYQSNVLLYAQAKAFNLTYKKLLDTIQAAVEGHAEELQKSILYMYALKEQALELMKQPLNAQENAGPTFEYPFG